jgi:hypothetical protein
MNNGNLSYLELMLKFPNGRFIRRDGFFGYWSKIKGHGNKLIAIFGKQTASK